jgi:hypothetical protein
MKTQIAKERLTNYFNEAKKHIAKIESVKRALDNVMPLDIESFYKLLETEQDKLDVLVFRFSKLQDLLGRKIFRAILEYSGFDINISFVKILSELEKESLLDVNRWVSLRDVRNAIAHEYPNEEENMIEEINFIYKEVWYLVDVTQKLEEYFYEINSKRDRDY